MIYTYINLLFLTVICLSLAVYTRGRLSNIFWQALLVLTAMTAVFDSIIILLGIVAYSPENIAGIYVWKAPIEDFAYTIAAVVMVALLWEHFERKKVDRQ